MANFTVNVTNTSPDGCVTISPMEARGFGCTIPPNGTMNFSFSSLENSDSITLAVMQMSEMIGRRPTISLLDTEGGYHKVRTDDIKPFLLEITNFMPRSTTRLSVG